MRYTVLCFFSLILVSCRVEQVKLPNEMYGTLKSVMGLNLVGAKSFLLDSETSPQPTFMQMVWDSSGNRQLTFLNNYNNIIYFYDYDKQGIIKLIRFNNEGSEAVKRPIGYHIKNLDSIYIYSGLRQVLLANEKGKILNRISLIGEHDPNKNPLQWALSFPEYYMSTSIPFMQTKMELLLSGLFPGDIQKTNVKMFRFTAHINFKLDSVYFTHTYPLEIFGNNYCWGGSLPMEVFPLLHPDGKRIIYSFVPSHDLYLSNHEDTNEYERVYAGSNFAGTISSLEKKTIRMGPQEVVSEFVRDDRYGAILHDQFRNVYYRFMRKSMPNAPIGTHWDEKDITVIIMDEGFKYLGETVLGPGDIWHWQNSFVTEEGLNIEYIDEYDLEEDYLNLKIFVPKKLN